MTKSLLSFPRSFPRSSSLSLAFSLCLAPGCVGSDGVNPVASDDSSADSPDSVPADDSADPCDVDTGTTASIDSPAANGTYVAGALVDLEATSNFTVASAIWTVDAETVAETQTATWIATAGSHTVGVTLETACGAAAATVEINVVESPVTVFDVEGMDARGLSVAPDGSLWAATSGGLVHLDGSGDTSIVRSYTTADGLYRDDPHAVLAHSDGTIWVGDVGDVDRQGSHLSLNTDGSLTLIEAIDFTESTEIAYVLRMREQPHGAGVGDVWMGTNEGLCLWDANLGVFAEHAHPTHPHDLAYGVAFTPDASVWNGDQYQLSRWEYSNDGNLSPSAMSVGGDLAEYWVPWPVEVEEQIGLTDLDADEWALWLVSSLHGVARVDVGTEVGTSVTTLLGDPFPATAKAVRADGDGHVWIGTGEGLALWDIATATMSDLSSWLPDTDVQQLTVDGRTSPPTVWAATPAGFVRFVGVP